MNKTTVATALVFSLALIPALTCPVQAQSTNPQETLNQYIADLQKNPADTALREKIIRHVQTMKPTPAIPEEARKHFLMAQTIQGKAKDTKDFELAISEYKKVLLIAPWWPEAYNNMGILLEQVGQYDEAMRAFELYVMTNPKDAREAQDKIYAIEAAKKMAEAEEERRREAERREQERYAWILGSWEVSGNIYFPDSTSDIIPKTFEFRKSGDIIQAYKDGKEDNRRVLIFDRGLKWQERIYQGFPPAPGPWEDISVSVSADQREIRYRRYDTGRDGSNIYTDVKLTKK